jgi:hypothetical protein
MVSDYKSALLLFKPQDGIILISKAEATGFQPVDDVTCHGPVVSLGQIDATQGTTYTQDLHELYLTKIKPFIIQDYGEANLNYLDPLIIKEASGGLSVGTFPKFHADHSILTMSIKLNHEYEGGGIAFQDSGLKAVSQGTGWGLLYPGHKKHASTPVKSGVRYTLRMSFYREEI